MRNLSEAIEHRPNNLNLIKCVASLLVIVSHAYAFAIAYETTDWYSVLTGKKGDLGGLAVAIFFFFSGLLITYSLLKNSDAKRFWKRRFWRIYPAYFLVIIMIVFVAAPVISKLNALEYYTHPVTYQYLLNLVFAGNQHLPGVFGENAYGYAVNGPLWTVRLEVVCYLVCFICQKLGLLKKKNIVITIIMYGMVVSGIIYLSHHGIEGLSAVVIPVTMYFLGMIFAVFSNKISLNGFVAIGCGILFVFASALHQVVCADVVFLPYLLCYLAFATKRKMEILNRLGEYSYETYLWGGFVGQFVTYMFGGYMLVRWNIAITIPLAIFLGFLTSNVVKAIEE